jgi:hypothetical protein
MADRPRKSRSKQAAASVKAPLFGDAPTTGHDAPQVAVLSSNFTIGPLLARGCLLPDALEGDALSDTGAPLRLQWSTGPIAADCVEALVASARNVVPIAVRLLPGRKVRHVSIGGQSALAECVALSDVEQLCFRNDKERVRFESLEFGNYSLPATGLPVGVDAGVLGGREESAAPSTHDGSDESATPTTAVGASTVAISTIDLHAATKAVRAADSRAGLLAYLLTGSPGWRVWMQGVEHLFAKKRKVNGTATWPENVVNAAVGATREAVNVDEALLAATVEVLAKYPVESGWPAEQVLAEVTEGAKARVASLDERAGRELARWSERAADVLASRAEPQSLADNGYVLQRAVLLLLLRGDLEGMSEGSVPSDSVLRPGPQVVGTASALAALRTGLRSMPSRFKSASDQQAPGRLLTYLGEAFLGMLAEPSQSSLIPASLPSPTISYRPIRTLQGEWIVTISSREVARRVAEFDRGLERLLTMGRHLGFEFEEHGTSGLVTHVLRPDGRRRPVFLDLLQSERSGGGVVRFSSPTLKLVGTNSRSRLPKEFLLDLLIRNASPDMNCRFAIVDDDSTIVALVDQLLATLDEAELKQHVQHVAQVADEFELSRGVSEASLS